MAGETRVVRAYIFPMIGFDLAVPDEAGDRQIRVLIASHSREAAGWFDTLGKPTVLGDGKMTLEFDPTVDVLTWEENEAEDEDAGGE